MNRKIIAALCCCVLLTLAGCGENAGPDTAQQPSAAVEQDKAQGLRIALVSSGAGIDDGSFVLDNYNGISDFLAKHKGSTAETVMEASGEPAAAVAKVRDIAADYDVIVCAGYQFSGISEIAENATGTKFILVDTFPTNGDGNEVSADNIYAMMFREEESGFLAGMAAALTTKTGKVAVVSGVALRSNINYQHGFMSGVTYANDNCGTSAEIVELAGYAGTDMNGANVGGNYVGSFNDAAAAKRIAEALIAEGCDVLFAAAGESGKGVLDAVKESPQDDWFIGSDTDRSRDGVVGGKNVVLTSVIKNMGLNDMRVLEDIADGSFTGGDHILGADTGSTGYVSTPERCRLTDEAKARLDEALELIKNGTIVI